MPNIILTRKTTNDNCTLGELSVFGEKVYTLEDPKREHKVWGETRIPAGIYDLSLRNEGGMTQRYAARFQDMHKGMLWLRDVPMFEWVYIHIGNTAKDTEGCVLVGLERGENRIISSKAAYQKIYPPIADAILGGGCRMVINDEN